MSWFVGDDTDGKEEGGDPFLGVDMDVFFFLAIRCVCDVVYFISGQYKWLITKSGKTVKMNNILEIHVSILKSFEEEEKEIPQLETRLKSLQGLTHTESILTEVNRVQARINSIRNKNNLYFYFLEAQPIIEEYKREMNKPIVMSFMGSVQEQNTDRLNQVVTQYRQLVERLVPLSRMPPHTISKRSPECGNCKRKNTYVIHSDNISACEYCGTEQDVLMSTFSYRDTERINMTSKYQYDRRVHFKECINQFQGKQNSTIKPQVYEMLRNQIRIQGMDVSKVSKKHVLSFLKEIRCSSHYEDVNLIHHTLTGQPLPNISHLEDVLIEDFDRLSKLYDEEYIKPRRIERKNFINIQYVLFQLLRRHRYYCSHTDFSFLKTIERKEFHDDICSHLFGKLGWNFQPIF